MSSLGGTDHNLLLHLWPNPSPYGSCNVIVLSEMGDLHVFQCKFPIEESITMSCNGSAIWKFPITKCPLGSSYRIVPMGKCPLGSANGKVPMGAESIFRWPRSAIRKALP